MKKLNLADIVSNEFYEFVDRYVKGRHKKRDKDILKAVVGVLECTPHIVRCNDCTLLDTQKCPMRPQLFPNGDFFCADGKPKEGDGNDG